MHLILRLPRACVDPLGHNLEMRFSAILLVMLLTSNADAEVKFFPSTAQLVEKLLRHKPRVMAFGEYHQVEGGAKVASAVKRFADQMLSSLAAAASDLVVETWVTEGKCGETETKAVAKVEESIKRPEATESELVTLIKRAKSAGVQPHILTLSCDEYEAIQPEGGEIDYVKLLGVVTTQLKKGIDQALAKSPKQKTVVVYGGALHNDLYPRKKELGIFSFAKAVKKQVAGRYLEVDLYVPEYIERDKEIPKEKWYAEWRTKQAGRAGQPALVERGPMSYIVIFPMTNSDPAAPAKQQNQP
jgi:hypothetical protein